MMQDLTGCCNVTSIPSGGTRTLRPLRVKGSGFDTGQDKGDGTTGGLAEDASFQAMQFPGI